MKVRKLVKKFLAHYERGVALDDFAESTLVFYQQRLKKFTREFGDRKIETLTRPEVQDFLFRIGEGMSNTTRHHDAVSVTTLQSFAVDQEFLEKPWWTKPLEKPPIGKRTFVPTPEDIDKVLEQADVPFRLVYAGLLQSGCRPGEICRMKISDIDFDRGVVILKQHKTARKTGKPRKVVVGKKFGAVLKTVIGARTEGAAFLNDRREPWRPGELSRTFRQLRVRAGLSDQYVLYSARHHAITGWVQAGVPIKQASEMAGHSSVVMTERYSHIDVEALGSAQDLV